MSCKIGTWGLPVVYFSRWETSQAEDSISTEATFSATPLTVQEGDASVNIAETTIAPTSAETSRAEIEQRLTQVTLEADR